MCVTEGARSVRLLRVSGKLHGNNKKEWQIILPRVELTLANEDDADCDHCDNGPDQKGGIEQVDICMTYTFYNDILLP